jgi:hypothetical protein
MNDHVIVVDDFLDDPEAVRRFALSIDYVPAWGSWRGQHSLERHPDTKEALFEISRLVSDCMPNWTEIDESYRYWKKASAGGFATMMEGDEGVVHAHRRSGDWAAVIYLSKREDCWSRDGTIFLQHKRTGIDRISRTRPPTVEERIAIEDFAQADAWIPTSAVPMRFNRLTLFDSSYIHCASRGFGTDLESCRLIQVFNFCSPEDGNERSELRCPPASFRASSS